MSIADNFSIHKKDHHIHQGTMKQAVSIYYDLPGLVMGQPTTYSKRYGESFNLTFIPKSLRSPHRAGKFATNLALSSGQLCFNDDLCQPG